MVDATEPTGEPLRDSAAAVESAMGFHQQGDLKRAEALYNAVLAQEPRHFTVNYLLGVLKNQEGDFQTAATFLERALQINPKSALAHLNLGMALWNLDRPEEALVHYQYSLRFKADHPDALLHCALALQTLGRSEESLTRWDQLLAVSPKLPLALINRGMVLQDLHRDEEAKLNFSQGIDLDLSLLAHLVGRAKDLRQAGRLEAALATLETVLQVEQNSVEALLVKGALLVDLGRGREALSLYTHTLNQHPDSTDVRLDLGNALMGLQQYEAALAQYEQVLARDPHHADALMNRGNALLKLDRPMEALACFDKAILQNPGHADSHLNRGNALLHLGRPSEALSSCSKALALRPNSPEALLNQANALLALKRPLEAVESCDLALALQPDCVEALVNRGVAELDLKRPAAALSSFDRALALRPNFPDLLMNHGTALHLLGRHAEAIGSYDKALTLDPSHARAHSNKIYLLDFLPEVGFAEHQQARREFFTAHAQRLSGPRGPFRNDRDPERRLVIGYVSADFKHHSAASCFLPILLRHDKAKFQINCYSGVQVEDDWTRRFREGADLWRPMVGLSDEALAAQVQCDAVDILVDLSGHSKGNRLLAFARKPAPIQVTAWGHGGGTGLPMIDYQFVDPVSVPSTVRALFAEAAWDLPCCITFEAPAFAPEIRSLPIRSRGWLTFGSLNRYTKVTPAVERLWAEILRTVPHSRLLLKDGLFDSAEGRELVAARFAHLGIDPERLDLRGHSTHEAHLAACSEVDIALDTFPQNGGITTWEALWMGAPVIALLGNKLASRISGAILTALGLEDWVCQSEAEYLETAQRKAEDLDALAQFRREIRPRILASAAGNPEHYTRAVEDAYRRMWRQWAGS